MWRTLFGAARRPRPSRRCNLSVEQLADRIVPALTVSFAGNVLSITGDPAADVALVRSDESGDILPA